MTKKLISWWGRTSAARWAEGLKRWRYNGAIITAAFALSLSLSREKRRRSFFHVRELKANLRVPRGRTFLSIPFRKSGTWDGKKDATNAFRKTDGADVSAYKLFSKILFYKVRESLVWFLSCALRCWFGPVTWLVYSWRKENFLSHAFTRNDRIQVDTSQMFFCFLRCWTCYI